MEQTNLFELFGIKPIEEKKETKKPVKKETGKAKSGQPKKKKGPAMIKAPVIVYTGYFEPVTLDAEQLGADKVKQDVLVDKVCEMFGFPKSMIYLDIEADKVFAIIYPSCQISKGTVHLKKDSKMILGNYQYDLSSIMTDDECSLDISELQKFVAAETPVLGKEKYISFYVKDNLIIPKSELPIVCSNVKFPVQVDILGRESMKITEEMYISALSEKKDKEGGNDSVEIEREVLIRLIEERFVDFKGHCDLRFHKDCSCAVVQLHGKNAIEPIPEEMIPVVDTTISLIFTKIPLNPEMFDGEEEVEKDEIVKYLNGIYPEYSKERTEIVYDKKKKIIIPILKGSKKGAGIEFVASEERETELLRQPGCLYEKEINDVVYRVENLPYLYACISKEKYNLGTHRLRLPKVPAELFAQAKEFFRAVSERFDTEAMLQLFWDSEEKEYFLYCPEQTVGHANLSVERNWELEQESWLIMDLHSHGTIGCSFSSIDDEDEKGTRYYGVFYGYRGNDEPKYDFRVGCGGYFLIVQKQELFENGNVSDYEFDFSDWMKQIVCKC